VKNLVKQLALTVPLATCTFENFHFFNIGKLIIQGCCDKHLSFFELYSLTTFQHLIELHLINLINFTTLDSLPLTLEILFLRDIYYLIDIRRIGQMNDLRCCTIIHCDKLKDVSSLAKNIPEMQLRISSSSIFTNDDLQVIENGYYDRFIFADEYMNQRVRLCRYDISCFHNVSKYLDFTGFIKDSCDLSTVCKVESLTLHLPKAVYPPIFLNMSWFNGSSLNIKGYNLLKLNTNNFSARNLSSLSLDQCYNVSASCFSQSPLQHLCIRTVKFSADSITGMLPIFQNLIELDIDSDNGFIQNSVVEYLGKIKKLTLSEIYGITTLEGLGNGNKFVKLVGLKGLDNFASLQGINEVTVCSCDNLVNAEQLLNIRYLTISLCDNFADCSKLGSGLYSLVLEELPNLILLKGKYLKNIQKIRVTNCPKLEDIDFEFDSVRYQEDQFSTQFKQFVVIQGCDKITIKDEEGVYDVLKKLIFYFQIEN
jgi:hypothetical protein